MVWDFRLYSVYSLGRGLSVMASTVPFAAPVAKPVDHAAQIHIGRHPERKGAYLLETTQWFPRPRPVVFDFFADASNLETITPPFLHFQIVTPRPIAMAAGALIDYRLSLHGVPIKWRTEIASWEPSHRFVDQQLKGPYHFWIHEHTFTDQHGGTLVKDAVTYSVPGGAVVHALIVKRDLTTIFAYRRKIMEQTFGT
jgi:ligand-binding SRPBCC domain-containing protein